MAFCSGKEKTVWTAFKNHAHKIEVERFGSTLHCRNLFAGRTLGCKATLSLQACQKCWLLHLLTNFSNTTNTLCKQDITINLLTIINYNLLTINSANKTLLRMSTVTRTHLSRKILNIRRWHYHLSDIRSD